MRIEWFACASALLVAGCSGNSASGFASDSAPVVSTDSGPAAPAVRSGQDAGEAGIPWPDAGADSGGPNPDDAAASVDSSVSVDAAPSAPLGCLVEYGSCVQTDASPCQVIKYGPGIGDPTCCVPNVAPHTPLFESGGCACGSDFLAMSCLSSTATCADIHHAYGSGQCQGTGGH